LAFFVFHADTDCRRTTENELEGTMSGGVGMETREEGTSEAAGHRSRSAAAAEGYSFEGSAMRRGGFL
jgi:hypothetical protein